MSETWVATAYFGGFYLFILVYNVWVRIRVLHQEVNSSCYCCKAIQVNYIDTCPCEVLKYSHSFQLFEKTTPLLALAFRASHCLWSSVKVQAAAWCMHRL